MKLEAEELKNFTDLNQSDIGISTNEQFEQIDLKIIDKDDMIGKEVFFNTPSRRSRRLGNTWAYMYSKEGIPAIVIGPHCKLYTSYL
jgi:hypothetical protein